MREEEEDGLGQDTTPNFEILDAKGTDIGEMNYKKKQLRKKKKPIEICLNQNMIGRRKKRMAWGNNTTPYFEIRMLKQWNIIEMNYKISKKTNKNPPRSA